MTDSLTQKEFLNPYFLEHLFNRLDTRTMPLKHACSVLHVALGLCQ